MMSHLKANVRLQKVQERVAGEEGKIAGIRRELFKQVWALGKLGGDQEAREGGQHRAEGGDC